MTSYNESIRVKIPHTLIRKVWTPVSTANILLKKYFQVSIFSKKAIRVQQLEQ